MPIVTIRGQLGSVAPEIGKLVADRLHAEYFDREIITRIAELFNRGEQDVMAKEMPSGTFLEQFTELLEKYCPSKPCSDRNNLDSYLSNRVIPMDDTRYLIGLKSIIKELASNSSIVIHGRGSQFILKNQSKVLHILLVVPDAIRIERIAMKMKLDKEAAKKEMLLSDRSQNEFIKRYFKAELVDSINYDPVINTENFSLEESASIIANAVRFKN